MDTRKTFRVDNWLVEPDRDRISNGTETRTVRPQVMELLVYLAERPGQVVSTEALLNDLWDGRVVTEGSVYNCISELRAVLAADGESAAKIETIPKKGYRLTGDVAAVDPATVSLAQKHWPVAAVVIAAVVVFGAAWLWPSDSSVESPPIRSLAVLPLENLSPDPERDAYFADGMTEALIARLGQIGELRIISRTSSMRLRDADMSIPEIARTLDIDGVIEGSILTADNEIRLTLKLIDGASDTNLWTDTYTREVDDILGLQEEIANSIAGALRGHLGSAANDTRPSTIAAREPPSNSPEAYRAFLKGRYYFNRFGQENFRTALDFYEEATTLDPEFALAYAAKAEACMQPSVIVGGIRTLDDCQRDAHLATSLDDDLPEGFAVLGFMQLLNWQWQESELSFQRAIELDPNSVMARQWYSLTLRLLYRHDASLAEIRLAEELDPLNLFVKTMVGWPLYNLGRHEEALAQWQDVIDMDPGFMLAHYNQGLSYIELRDAENTFEAARRVAAISGENSFEARLLSASAHAIAGNRDQSIEIIDAVERDAGSFWPAWIASIYLMLGDEDRALSRLEQGLADRSPDLMTIAEPKFDAVRQHPRFVAISRAMGLPTPGVNTSVL